MDSLESLFSLRGHVGLVTGVSSGLGIECATALAMAGADVAIVARRRERLERAAHELRKLNVKVVAIVADITVAEDLDRIVAQTVAELGEIDILVNNAGISSSSAAQRFPLKVWEATFATNVTATMMLSQRVVLRLIERKKPGRIINVTSTYATVAGPYKRPYTPYRMSAYAASKGAVANLTRQLAVEWAEYGINVNSLAPGMVATELNERGLMMPGIRERTESFSPYGRLCKPEEIRGAVVFLASAASSYMTGATVAVDGGYTAW